MLDPVKRLSQAPQVNRSETMRASADFIAMYKPTLDAGDSVERSPRLEPQPGRASPGPGAGFLARRQEWKLNRASSPQQRSSSQADKVDPALAGLQNHLERLEQQPRDSRRQDEAHAALTKASTVKHNHALPVLHKALQIGVAGSLPTFGVGRTLGVHYGPRLLPLSKSDGFKAAQKAGAQWVLGGVGGGVGNLLGKTLIAPVVDTLPRHYRAIDPSAILPDRMVAKMNRLRSGWGDEVRAEIVQQQKEILYLGSQTNVQCAERAFGAATAARFLLQPQGFKPTLPKSLALTSGVAGLAGAAVGANMGVNMARAVVHVPRQEALDSIAVSKDRSDQEMQIMESAVALPLFYAHKKADGQRQGPLQAIGHRWHMDHFRDPVPSWQNPSDRKRYPDWNARMHGVASDVHNLGMSAASRAEYMMRATLAPTVLGAVQPFVEASMPGSFSARMTSVLLPVLAIRMVIRPWFDAVAGGIPARDAARRAKRQAAVDVAVPPPNVSVPQRR